MTPETTVLIGESIGPVIPSNDLVEMEGGTFMHVRVMVDVSQPLYCGRKIAFDEGPLIYVSGAVCWIMMIRIAKFG